MSGDLITVGLSEMADQMLDKMKEDKLFLEKMDGYRLGIALALAQGADAPDFQKRKTLFNVGSLDPDQALKKSIEVILGASPDGSTTYRVMEKLADWGVRELFRQADVGEVDFVALLDQLAEKTD
jgi:hypothetical protein